MNFAKVFYEMTPWRFYSASKHMQDTVAETVKIAISVSDTFKEPTVILLLQLLAKPLASGISKVKLFYDEQSKIYTIKIN